MANSQTRKTSSPGAEGGSNFLARKRAILVVLAGPSAGTEYELCSESIVLGRGPGADVVFDDGSMSRQHAALELMVDGYRVRDMGSTNGIEVNGASIPASDLKHGDKISMGEHVLQYVLEERTRVAIHEI